MAIWMYWELRWGGSCCRVWVHIMTMTRLLNNISLLDIRCSYFHLFLGHIVVILILWTFVICVLRVILLCSGVLWYWTLELGRVAWDMLLSILISTNAIWILLQFDSWDCWLVLLRPIIRLVTWEVLRSSLMPNIIDLWYFLPGSIRVIYITCHISITFVIMSLRCWLICIILDYFYSLCFLLRIFGNRYLLLLNNNITLLVWFQWWVLSTCSFLLLWFCCCCTWIAWKMPCNKGVWEFIPCNSHCKQVRYTTW